MGLYRTIRGIKGMKKTGIAWIAALALALAISMMVGCNKTNTADYNNKTIEKPEAEPTKVPRPEPTEKPEEQLKSFVENETEDPEEVFKEKISGVWGNLTGGCYFEFYDGLDIQSGWFESDALPNSHIKEITEVSDEKYKVVIEVDPGYDEDGNEYEGYTYEAIYDGSMDGFRTCFIASNDTSDYLYIRLGNDMDEAWDYYCGSFVDDYKRIADGYKGKLRESPVGRWYTENYDEINNWAGSYYIDLYNDGTALCSGWRNKDTGTYIISEPGKLSITFDHCECDDPSIGGWGIVKGFAYTIDMEYSGDDAVIKINAPDVISNLTDGNIHRNQ